MESIEQMTGCRVEPCFITSIEFEEQMERLTSFPDYEEIAVDDPGTPEKMARRVGRAAVDVRGREALFSQYKDLVWARILGKRGKVDVIFRVSQGVEEARAQKSEIFYEPTANFG